MTLAIDIESPNTSQYASKRRVKREYISCASLAETIQL